MEPELVDFLRRRNIEERIILELEQEKIDVSVITSVNMDELSRFIPKLGDRIAIQNFCKDMHNVNKRKGGLIERLKRKMESKKKKRPDNSPTNSSDEDSQARNKTGKVTRQIEVGWIHEGTQVRTKAGGGTRKVDVLKTARKQDIIKVAKDLFFPHNTSSKGLAENCDFNLIDFKMNTVENGKSVEEIFDITKLSRLRFYLATKNKTTQNNIGWPVRTRSSRTKREISINSDSEVAINKSPQRIETITSGAYERLANQEIHEATADEETEVLFENPTEYLLDIPKETEQLEYEDLVRTLFDDNSNANGTNDSTTEAVTDHTILNITLHRGQVFKELSDSVETIDVLTSTLVINIEMILPNGTKEAGLDVGGVFRDALSEYWNTFYETCTNGTSYKVPIIREDYNRLKWEAVAKVIFIGWKYAEYFPIQLAPIFMECCIFGNQMTADLVENFFRTLSESENKVLKSAVIDFQGTEFEDLLEVCSNLDCKRLPTDLNIKGIVYDIAHKEIIQKPKYIIDCWQSILKNFMSQDTLTDIYTKREVTPKNVLNIICPPMKMSENESKVLAYLKKFIRECDKKTLANFLRFCSGADMITDKVIVIEFNSKEGFQRTPTAHTCSATLELPVGYENYPEFRYELNSVLTSNVWIMDFA